MTRSLAARVATCGIAPALTALALAVPAADAASGFGVTAVPLRAGAPAPAYFKLRLAAGGSAARAVEVTNRTRHTLRFHVSAVDGVTGVTSGAVYENRDVPRRETGTWVTPGASRLTVPARSRVRVPFEVRIPAGARPGQYLAGLAVEDAAAKLSGRRGFRVREILRTVVGVLVRVPGPQRFVPTLSSLAITELPGPHVASVKVGLGNAGRRLGKPTLKVALTGPDGYHRTVTRRLDTILGQDAIAYPLAWPDDLAAGDYDVTATLSFQGASVTRHASAHLGSPLRGTATAPHTLTAGGGSGTPWLLLAGVLVAGLLGGLLLRRRPQTGGAV